MVPSVLSVLSPDDFATSRNNDPRNGLALTPDAHRSFDEHLWTDDEHLRVVHR